MLDYATATNACPSTRLAKEVTAWCMPAWERADHFDRLAEAYEVIGSKGGRVFTLRLDKDALVAVTGSKDPVRVMSRRIQRAFKRAKLAVPYFAFSLEVTPDDRDELHLHGAIVLGTISPSVVKNVLRSAAGYIPGRAGSRQVQLKNFDLEAGGPAGWANYVKKGATRTSRVIEQERLTYIDQSLRQLAKLSWEQRRQQVSKLF
ncbi:hypothetical protein [Devosia sp. 919]|uniref:hypothetical protein n=1 Tax=Devosia sp. 919 TaxID=2726065 RepID=UPI0015524DEF|nr:hypothetical protein [Devosia sp. 919]